MLRAARLEASLFNACLQKSPRSRSANHSLGEGFERMAMQSNAFTLFLRYQAQAERNYRRAMEEFEYLKAQRDVLPNQPILEAQPEENKDRSSESCVLVSTRTPADRISRRLLQRITGRDRPVHRRRSPACGCRRRISCRVGFPMEPP